MNALPPPLADDLAAALRREAAGEAGRSELPSLLELSSGLDASSRGALAASLSAHPRAFVDACAVLRRARAGGKDDALCQWLYALYREGGAEGRAFVIRFVPLLVYAVLRSRRAVGAAAVLLAVHSRERTEGEAAEGGPLLGDFVERLPDLSEASPYHEAPKGDGAAPRKLTAEALRSLAEDLASDGQRGDVGRLLPPVGSLSEGAVQELALVCLARYVTRIAEAGRASQVQLCLACARLCGYPAAEAARAGGGADGGLEWGRGGGGGGVEDRRVALSRPVALVLARGVAYCHEFAWSREAAALATRALHVRATEELWADVLLTTTCALERAELERRLGEARSS